MDKLLESRFTLKGGRPRASVMGNMTIEYLPGRSSSDRTSTVEQSPSITKGSPLDHSRSPSDTELGSGSSTVHSSENSHTLRAESSSGSGDDEPHQATADEELKEKEGQSEEKKGKNKEDEDETVVAYYVQPGGKIVPVDILPGDRPGSKAASIREVANEQESGSASTVSGESRDSEDNGQGEC